MGTRSVTSSSVPEMAGRQRYDTLCRLSPEMASRACLRNRVVHGRFPGSVEKSQGSAHHESQGEREVRVRKVERRETVPAVRLIDAILAMFGFARCCGIALKTDCFSPRPGSVWEGGELRPITTYYSEEDIRAILRTILLTPFQMGHWGKSVGIVLWADLSRKHVRVWGICRQEFAGKSVLSVCTAGLPVKKFLHVAIAHDSLGAFDTFLNKGWVI